MLREVQKGEEHHPFHHFIFWMIYLEHLSRTDGGELRVQGLITYLQFNKRVIKLTLNTSFFFLTEIKMELGHVRLLKQHGTIQESGMRDEMNTICIVRLCGYSLTVSWMLKVTRGPGEDASRKSGKSSTSPILELVGHSESCDASLE